MGRSSKSDRIILDDLVWDISTERTATDDDAHAAGVRKILCTAMTQNGVDFPDAAKPGVIPHLKRMIEAGEITPRSMDDTLPALSADAVIPQGGIWRSVSDGTGLPDYKISTLSLWYLTPEEADIVLQFFGLPERYSKPEQDGMASATEGAAKDPRDKPLPRQRWQEQEILRVIGELGHKANELPKPQAGRRGGVRAQVRKRLTDPMWTEAVFKKAWNRLIVSEEIEYT